MEIESANFIQVVPNSHFWTDLTHLQEWLKYANRLSKEQIIDHLKIGLINTLENGYNIQKTQEKFYRRYFIEDVETNEWYCYPFELMPTVHSSSTGWDKPNPKNQDYWTKDPHKAFQYFYDKFSAELYLDNMIKRNDLSLLKGDIGFEKRKLIITEHEFVN